ncbi:hypothetical protein MCUN1_002409 [Malassezia cuniculi]|uniref:Elongation factor 1-gamma n=1 Tax=Malassezia cuniculi TaxID=948313 RepID=A0AAF0ERH8_9BASI|nr:hypothetical protein MCUN1_002409 [Malassezia cuniculi]
MSIGKIYGPPTGAKVLRSVAAAKANGLELEVVPTAPRADSGKPEFLAKFPHGKVPAFEGSDGFLLPESRAIAWYVASLSDNAQLLGTDNKSTAQITQWINFADDEIFNRCVDIILMHYGLVPYNKAHETRAFESLERALKVFEGYIVKHTFAVGDALTLADITLASDLYMLFHGLVGADWRAKYPHTMRYYNTMIAQRPIKETFPDEPLREETIKYTPPKKEKKEEAAPAAAAAGGAAAGAAAAAAPAAAEPAPKKEKAKNPLDLLPPSSFVLDEWKRTYMNEDTRAKALPWFYEHFDPEGFSIWRFDFKYNEELTQIFMSSNQISGFFSRLEESRKYVMGTGGVFGTANNSVIAGVFVARGKDANVFNCAPDIDSYTLTPLDITKDEDKKFFEDVLAWEATIDGKPWADGKIFR